jgi:hypothetical protein
MPKKLPKKFLKAMTNQSASGLSQRHRRHAGVDFLGRFVTADGLDAGETQGEAGVVTGRLAIGVKGDFEDDVGLDVVFAARFAQGVALEVPGEFLDPVVGEAARPLPPPPPIPTPPSPAPNPESKFLSDGRKAVGGAYRSFRAASNAGKRRARSSRIS